MLTLAFELVCTDVVVGCLLLAWAISYKSKENILLHMQARFISQQCFFYALKLHKLGHDHIQIHYIFTIKNFGISKLYAINFKYFFPPFQLDSSCELFLKYSSTLNILLGQRLQFSVIQDLKTMYLVIAHFKDVLRDGAHIRHFRCAWLSIELHTYARCGQTPILSVFISLQQRIWRLSHC